MSEDRRRGSDAYLEALDAAKALHLKEPGRIVLVLELVCNDCQRVIATVQTAPNGDVYYVGIIRMFVPLIENGRSVIFQKNAMAVSEVLLNWPSEQRPWLKDHPVASCERCRPKVEIDEAKLLAETQSAIESGRKRRVPLRRVAV